MAAAGTRRTQAQRRAETIELLLGATIESLMTVGFAATTTRGVAERAGVSQGAQQHYFATKAELIDAAINKLAQGFIARIDEQSVEAPTEAERAGLILDRLWEVYTLPGFAAVFELLNLARTDAVTARLTASTLTTITDQIVALATEALPVRAARPGFRDLLLIVLGSIRDTAMILRIPGAEATVPDWPAVRATFLRLLDPPGDEDQVER